MENVGKGSHIYNQEKTYSGLENHGGIGGLREAVNGGAVMGGGTTVLHISQSCNTLSVKVC